MNMAIYETWKKEGSFEIDSFPDCWKISVICWLYGLYDSALADDCLLRQDLAIFDINDCCIYEYECWRW